VTDPDLIGLFVEPLEAIGVSYMITGGVASVIYGDPRFTRDVDIVMEFQRSEIPALESAFDPATFYVPPAEALEKEASRPEGGGAGIWVAPIEYVILRKLEYYEQAGSDRHLRDVAMMLRISGDRVDPGSLMEWAQRLDLVRTLEQARRFSPD
jgi:hypothetical protein